MRILLVGNYSLDKQVSMKRYADMLSEQLAVRGHQVETIRPSPILGRWFRVPVVRKWLAYLDKYILFPPVLRARAKAFDLVHVCDHSNSMYLGHVGNRAASITCHDLLAINAARGSYPQQRVSSSGKVLQRWILRNLAGARNVVCVSAHTAGELTMLSNGADQRIRVIPNALNSSCAPASEESVRRVREQIGIRPDEIYLLHVGSDHWYKNRPGVIRIFQALLEKLRGGTVPAPRIVMAGQQLSGEMRDFITAHLPEGSVVEVVNPSDEVLWSLYSGATALLFPSWQEGFGWPIIEAQRCGCPVITSNRSPMAEVAALAALYIDPTDESAAGSLIAANLDSISNLKEAGFRNADRFEASVVFRDYEEFFTSVAQEYARRTPSSTGGH